MKKQQQTDHQGEENNKDKKEILSALILGRRCSLYSIENKSTENYASIKL